MKSLLASVLSLSAIIVSEAPAHAATVGGTLASNTVWSPAMNPVHVTSTVTVPSGFTLIVQAGTLIRMTNGASLTAQAGAAISIEGTETDPIRVLGGAGTNLWGTINGSGSNSFVTVRHADVAGGGISLGSRCTGLIEDAYVHDVRSAIVANSAKFVTVRRVHVERYSETIFNSGTVVLVEDSLFENMTQGSSDCLEIQNGPPGSEIRRCTFRHAKGSNSDAVDCNGSTNVFVHDCLIYDISDKGCSFGTATAFNQPASLGMVVSNCLIYNVNTCVAVKDKSTATLFKCDLLDSVYGVNLYQKYSTPVAGGGGRITGGSDNLIWGSHTNLLIATNSSIVTTYSDVEGTNFPGAGNFSGAPIYLNQGLADFRLAPNSPGTGAGRDGGNIGCRFPVGAPMALSHPRIESESVSNGVVTVHFWADAEKSYTLESSTTASGGGWMTATNVPTRSLPVLVKYSAPLAAGHRFFRLSTP